MPRHEWRASSEKPRHRYFSESVTKGLSASSIMMSAISSMRSLRLESSAASRRKIVNASSPETLSSCETSSCREEVVALDEAVDLATETVIHDVEGEPEVTAYNGLMRYKAQESGEWTAVIKWRNATPVLRLLPHP